MFLCDRRLVCVFLPPAFPMSLLISWPTVCSSYCVFPVGSCLSAARIYIPLSCPGQHEAQHPSAWSPFPPVCGCPPTLLMSPLDTLCSPWSLLFSCTPSSSLTVLPSAPGLPRVLSFPCFHLPWPHSSRATPMNPGSRCFQVHRMKCRGPQTRTAVVARGMWRPLAGVSLPPLAGLSSLESSRPLDRAAQGRCLKSYGPAPSCVPAWSVSLHSPSCSTSSLSSGSVRGARVFKVSWWPR